MTNAEYYKEEFAAVCPDWTFCDFIKEYVLPTFQVECKDLFCEDCQKILAMWTAQEYKKLEFTEGELIKVRISQSGNWIIRPFIRYDENSKSVVCGNLYNDNTNLRELHWDHFKPLTVNEKEKLSKQVPFNTSCGTWIKVRNCDQEPWKVRQFIDFEDLKTRVDEPDYHHRVCYAESALLTNEDYYNMQLS